MQQLHVLEASGLIRTEKVGRVRLCHLEPKALRRLEGWMATRRQEWERRFDRLGDMLDADKEKRS